MLPISSQVASLERWRHMHLRPNSTGRFNLRLRCELNYKHMKRGHKSKTNSLNSRLLPSVSVMLLLFTSSAVCNPPSRASNRARSPQRRPCPRDDSSNSGLANTDGRRGVKNSAYLLFRNTNRRGERATARLRFETALLFFNAARATSLASSI